MGKIGYFKIHIETKKFIGGIMIADERGIPIEFKYTEPVEPTRLQKVLYGDVLEKYLREEVIMSSLISKVEKKPDIYIVDEIKNSYLRKYVKEDVAVIKKTQLKPLKEFNAYKFIKENEAILQLNEGESPIRVIVDNEDKEKVLDKILKLEIEGSITEPLERIEEALDLICKGEL